MSSFMVLAAAASVAASATIASPAPRPDFDDSAWKPVTLPRAFNEAELHRTVRP